MRKFMILFAVILALIFGSAQAESPANALGLAGSEESSVPGAQAARTSADLFQVMQDGELQSLVRVPGLRPLTKLTQPPWNCLRWRELHGAGAEARLF